MNPPQRGIWRKWVVAAPIIFVTIVALTKVTGGFSWFLGSWQGELFFVATLAMLAGATYAQHLEYGQRRVSFKRALFGVGFLAEAFVSVYDRSHTGPLNRASLWSVCGLILCGLAIPVGLAAMRTLGRYHTPEPEIVAGHCLVTHGIYSHLRHPIYSAGLLWSSGLPMLLGSLWGLVTGLGIVGLAVLGRIREEEALLNEAFGEAYQAYQARTYRVVPYVY